MIPLILVMALVVVFGGWRARTADGAARMMLLVAATLSGLVLLVGYIAAAAGKILNHPGGRSAVPQWLSSEGTALTALALGVLAGLVSVVLFVVGLGLQHRRTSRHG